MTIETPLKRARGLGAAHAGAGHWWHERQSALAALLLLVWLAVSLARLPALDHQTVTQWLREPLAAVPMLLLILAFFWHLKLGLKVIVEDYAHEEGGKLAWLVLIDFGSLFAGALAAFSVLKIAFAPLGAGAS